MTEVGERYVEQLSTTVETLRRRFVAYYDGVFVAGERLTKAAERTKEILEPASLDLRDHVNTACSQTDPIAKLDKDWRNTLVETYLGISLLMTGLAYGQMTGVYALNGLMNRIFDGYIELGLVVIIPIYVYLLIRKNAALDDMDRRSVLFGLSMSMGALAGHLMPSTSSMAPAVHFIPPLVFALLIDNEILCTPLVDMDRVQFFAFGSAITTILGLLAGFLPIGYLSVSVFLAVAIHSAFFALHFQLTSQSEKDKTFSAGMCQLAYVLVIFGLELLFSSIFGVNPLIEVPPKI